LFIQLSRQARLRPGYAVAVGALAIATLSFVTPAKADSTEPDTPGRVRLSAGVQSPRDQSARDLAGTAFATLGATYTITHNLLIPNSELEVYADYDAGSKSVDISDSSITVTGTGQVHALGIGPALRISLGNATKTHLFIDGGVGLYFSTAKFGVSATDGTNSANLGSISHNSSGIGGRILVGVEKAKGVFGEIGYDVAPSVALDLGSDSLKIKPGGLLVRIGYHFF
jgi:hypothetical protein